MNLKMCNELHEQNAIRIESFFALDEVCLSHYLVQFQITYTDTYFLRQ